MVRKESAKKTTGRSGAVSPTTPDAPITIPFTINPKQPHFWKMTFLPERGYDMSKAHPNFRATVEALQWEKFVEHRAFYLEQIVREFYAGMITNSGKILTDHSVVRGKRVKFDEATINQHYNLRFTGTTFDERYANYGKNKMELIKNRVAIPNCEWDRFTHSEFKLKIKYIIPECNWQQFINCSIMPTSHNYTLSKDRLIILDCILNDEQINVGKIINKEIQDCARKTEGFLFFPCLITELCMNHEVDISENELNQKKTPPAALSAAMKPRRVSKAPEVTEKKKEKEEKVEKNKKDEEKEMALKRFLLDQHEWIKKNFEDIFQRSSTGEIPEFPMWIFESNETEKEAEEEPVKKKKERVMKRKKAPAKKGNVKKRKLEEEWIDIEESEEEEDEAFKKMEKETDEEEGDTATESSEKDSFDAELDMTMEEILRKRKGKSPVVEQIDPSIQSPTKSVKPPSSTEIPPIDADVIQKEKQTEEEPTPTIAQVQEKTPTIQEETPITSPNITARGSVLQVTEEGVVAHISMPQRTTRPEGEKTATTDAATPAGASAPHSEPVITKVVEGNIDETLNLVVGEMIKQKLETIGKQKPDASKSKEGEEVVKEPVAMEAQKESTKEGEAEKDATEESPTLKEAAETLRGLTEKVAENTADVAKATHTLSGANAPETAPLAELAPEATPGATAPVVTPETKKTTKPGGTESKSGSKSGKKQPKPKPTPTRSSSRLRSGAKP